MTATAQELPSTEKPWLKYYSKESRSTPLLRLRGGLYIMLSDAGTPTATYYSKSERMR